MASSVNAGSGDPDMVLIGELMEEISRRPPAIAARKLLVEHYISVGWLEAATDNAKELKLLSPGDSDVLKFLQLLEKRPELPAPEKKLIPMATRAPNLPIASTVEKLVCDAKSGRYKKAIPSKAVERKPVVSNEVAYAYSNTMQEDLVVGYQALRIKADFVLADLVHLQALQKKANILPSKNTAKIQYIVEGRADAPTQLCNPRATARAMREAPNEATNIAIADMEEAIQWHEKLPGSGSGGSTDTIRDALIKRITIVKTALPDDMKIHCEAALMHMEHEHLDRNYANTETMYGDEVKDIPRSNFYVTEDNYAWDLDELVAAIKAGSGILRNPLSKQMFTPTDIKGIYMHPLAKPLAALAVEQKAMSKGVRPATITRMEKLASILLEDQSTDTMPSRHAVDEFLAYVATCL